MDSRRAICTIVTRDFIPAARALADSVWKNSKVKEFCVLVLDRDFESKIEGADHRIHWFGLRDVAAVKDSVLVIQKYKKSSDRLRWSLKPVFLSFLLQRGFEMIFYADPDIFFFTAFDFLFEELEQKAVLLCPHRRCSDPAVDRMNFELNFKDGIFNGGFLGVSRQGESLLRWWAQACLYACEKNYKMGRFVDQKYLDAVPALFENVGVLRHPGCNVANWNQTECRRAPHPDGSTRIRMNGDWDVVFVHFTRSTICGIESGPDRLLKPYLEAYLHALQQHDPGLSVVRKIRKSR